ncbi:MAG: chorismate mutase, partial [Clostridia bacterium]|nr:chorismate mutase [Clostridia bacterium]
MNELEELRGRIDRIDDKIAELFNERMNVVRFIGEEKSKTGTAVTDFGREKSIINRVCKAVDEDKIVYTKQLFETLFDASKAYQVRFSESRSEVGEEIRRAVENTPEEFPAAATVACQGVEG